MKFLKLLFACFYLISVTAVAQEIETGDELGTSFLDLKEFFLPTIIASALVLLADAKKWMFSGQWSFKVFLMTKIKPFLLSLIVTIAIYYLIALLPWTKQFIEVLGGYELTTISAATLSGMATAIIDGFLKRKEGTENA